MWKKLTRKISEKFGTGVTCWQNHAHLNCSRQSHLDFYLWRSHVAELANWFTNANHQRVVNCRSPKLQRQPRVSQGCVGSVEGENDQTGINQWHLKDLLEQRSAIRKWRSYHIAVNSRDPFVEGEMSKRLLKSAWHFSYAVLTLQIAHSSVRRLGLLCYFWTVKWTRSLPK